jgi:hypothetical protein
MSYSTPAEPQRTGSVLERTVSQIRRLSNPMLFDTVLFYSHRSIQQ